MKRHYITHLLIILLLSVAVPSFAQSLQTRLEAIPGIKVTPITNSYYKEYYEINFTQYQDHSNQSRPFTQRAYLGISNTKSPVVISTEGYAADYASKSEYNNELATGLNANLLVVEHRFTGRSIPDTSTLDHLTLRQAAGDYHRIKQMLDTVLTGNWISTGISKGGQAALAWKLYYPKDVAATVVYGTAVKNKQSVNTDEVLAGLSKTACGQKITALQTHLFKNKKVMLGYFSEYARQKGYNFSLLDDEKVFDYLVLELPYSFWQNGNECSEIPATTKNPFDLVNYVTKIVPPRYFSLANKPALEASFYMFYHELGYYEYNTAPFKAYLTENTYSNQFFAPLSLNIQFDDSYQKAIQEFMKGPEAENIYFIYGQNDPWALQTTIKRNCYYVKGGCHKSRIKDLPVEQQTSLYTKLKDVGGKS
ncbi:MAG: S28 family serine protease [Bacteroidota bacterium]